MISQELEKKYHHLQNIISSWHSLGVAFSGGVDSAFLLYVAHDILKEKAIAITVVSPVLPEWERQDAEAFCKEHGIVHEAVSLDLTGFRDFALNPANRCYHCKRLFMGQIIERCRLLGCDKLAEGSNIDDLKDYRPGLKAVEELQIVSPLQEAGLSKQEIRMLAHHLGLSIWEKPSSACLASRIPYGEEITREKLARIQSAEKFLHELGFHQIRVRARQKEARIELEEAEINRLMEPELRRQIHDGLKNMGFTYVSMDLGGFCSGNMKQEIFVTANS